MHCEVRLFVFDLFFFSFSRFELILKEGAELGSLLPSDCIDGEGQQWGGCESERGCVALRQLFGRSWHISRRPRSCVPVWFQSCF